MNSKVLEQLYKSKSTNFGKLDQRRIEKSEKLKNDRQERRVHNFNERRNIQFQESDLSTEECNENAVVLQNPNMSNVSNRKLALKKYLAEKEMIKMTLRQAKRPPFKVGIPHHGSSPLLRNIVNHPHKYNSKNVPLKKQSPVKRRNKNDNASELKKCSTLSNNNNKVQLKRKRCSLLQREVTHEERRTKNKKSSKSNSRNIRKTSTNKRQDVFEFGQASNDQECKSEVDLEGPMFQRARLDAETSRLLMLANEWEKIRINEDIPTEIADEIDSVVGNTKLLTRDKFNQFRGLIEKCENPPSVGPTITCNDLNGFWEMMYLQVEPLIQRYEDLKALKENKWIKQKPQLIKKPRTKKTKYSIRKLNICKMGFAQDFQH